MEKRPYNKMTPSERQTLFSFLQSVLVPSKTGQDMWAYTDGYTDERVAEETGRLRKQVEGFRVQMFGNIENRQKSQLTLLTLEKRVIELEKQLARFGYVAPAASLSPAETSAVEIPVQRQFSEFLSKTVGRNGEYNGAL